MNLRPTLTHRSLYTTFFVHNDYDTPNTKNCFMKKNATKQLVVTICLSCFICLLSVNVDAQCRYRVVNMLNDTVSYSIPSDFPLKVNTGDSSLDQSNFIAAFTAWNKNSVSLQSITLPTILISGIKNVFFEISASDFTAFSDDRKTAIRANPQLYLILP